MELRKENLVDLKQEVLKQSNNGEKSRIILTGDKPILLATTVFMGSDTSEYNNHFYEFFQKNGIHSSLLDSFIYTLFKDLGVYGVIDYIPMEEVKKDVRAYKQESRLFFDQEFRNLLVSANIDALYSLNNGRFIANRSVDNLNIHELNNSFSFCGLTGTTKGLTNLLDKASINYHCMYGGGLDIRELKALNYYFTDDTIRYNKLLNIGKVRNKPLERKNMLPRSLDISLNDNMELTEFYNIFIEYLEWALNELERKGTYEAMSPMRKLN